MVQPLDRWNRCLAMIAVLDSTYSWNLGKEEQQQYATHVAPFVSEDCQDEMLQRIIVNYHVDHEVIEQLRNLDHPQHDTQWTMWIGRVVGIIRQAGFAWSNDPAVNIEDLAQVAQVELIRSIGSFSYQSRFSTWSYRVIVQSIRRFVRDSKASKRRTRPDSLNQEIDIDVPIGEAHQPENEASAQVLAEHTLCILQEHDNRLALIFSLWAIQDRRVEEIAEVVKLHPSRVRALLKQARMILQKHPDIQDWQDNKRPRDEDEQ